MNTVIGIYACLLLIFTILPLIRNDYWIFRVFDYPRLQKLFLNVIALILLFTCYSGAAIYKQLLIPALCINIIYLLWLIIPFTPIGKKQVLKSGHVNKLKSLSIMIANVLQTNNDTKGCLNEIEKADPDIVILLEANNRWDAGTSSLKEKYPFAEKVPLENMYGLLLYSKLEMLETSTKYLVENDIPSIHTKIKLRNGQLVQFYAVHPTPPVPGENVRATERDKELLLVADLARKSQLPVIVAGDLNDVAWSHTTDLFLKMSGLLDPRRGRGFFNSFNAHYFFLRFPLDHAFISRHFKVTELKRLHNYHSDHFPIFLQIQLDEDAYLEQKPLQPDSEDIEEATEKKEKI